MLCVLLSKVWHSRTASSSRLGVQEIEGCVSFSKRDLQLQHAIGTCHLLFFYIGKESLPLVWWYQIELTSRSKIRRVTV